MNIGMGDLTGGRSYRMGDRVVSMLGCLFRLWLFTRFFWAIALLAA